ncbi:hypothetical protein ACFFMR_20345 [Micromonospora andamanensis]|uniref:Uncharacterized protein n=1 Tax=Micromonospora andamanensis TaxID=1287068 RepID=A0ABQ4HZH5_9ACTN|nr:hypothetical protein [Micromonospora andamanensis]GIJ11032.1 hypothetical protein Van01_42460 [Micromonospora andamanensis]GIJ39817.1 hypothetical protein Vwe01_31420 [Micromonospora andamanensis]
MFGLIQRWGQQVPRWVPGLRNRQVPRLLAIIPAAAVALTLVTYSALSGAVFVGQLRTGELRWSDVREEWAVAGTLLVFLGWGVALGVATVGYALATGRGEWRVHRYGQR